MKQALKKALILVVLTANLPAAPTTYPSAFNFYLAKTELEQIAQKEYVTHQNKNAERLHAFAEKVLFLPFRAFVHCQAYFVQPCPGAQKECSLAEKTLRKVAAFWGSYLTFMPALGSLIVGMPVRVFTHKQRPLLNYLYQPQLETLEKISMSREKPLHIATFNVSLTPSSVNIKMDLRSPLERAQELSLSLLNDPLKPDILLIEEGWNEPALKLFCENLSQYYPHIIHSIAPQILGMSSGIALFSRYKMESVHFFKLDNMIPLHSFPPRGIFRVEYATEQGPLWVYGGIHTQSLDAYPCIEARYLQIQQLKELMHQDAKTHPNYLQVAMGDLNISWVDMYGHSNHDQPENRALMEFHQSFEELYLIDHDQTGKRVSGEAFFLASDNQRAGKNFSEPTATWYDGPFTEETEKESYLTTLYEERISHGYPRPHKLQQNSLEPCWGTSRWFEMQPSLHAKYDYIFVPKNSRLTGRAEIRHIVHESAQPSASSDHLPIHARIWVKED